MPVNSVSTSLFAPKASLNHHGDSYDQAMHQEEMDQMSENKGAGELSSSSPKTRLPSSPRNSKVKIKRFFNVDGSTVTSKSEPEEDGVLDGLKYDAAFHTGALVKKKRFRPAKAADKSLGNMRSFGKAVIHPIDSIKSKATHTTAIRISKAERPFLSPEADKEYLEAHDNLKRAESISSSKQGTSDEEHESIVGDYRNRLQKIEAHRESLRAAWITSRHVRRVRVVPKKHIDLSGNHDFFCNSERGTSWCNGWLEWLGHVRR